MRLDRYGIIVIGAIFILCTSKNGQIKYFSKAKKQSTYKIGNTSRNAGGTPSFNGSTMEVTSWTCEKSGKGAINEAKFVGFVEKYTILLLRTDSPSHGKTWGIHFHLADFLDEGCCCMDAQSTKAWLSCYTVQVDLIPRRMEHSVMLGSSSSAKRRGGA